MNPSARARVPHWKRSADISRYARRAQVRMRMSRRRPVMGRGVHLRRHVALAAQRAGLAEAGEGFEDVLDAVGLGAFEGLRERRRVGGGGEGRERGADGEGLFREGFRPLGRRMRDEG